MFCFDKHRWFTVTVVMSQCSVWALNLPPKYYCTDPSIPWDKCSVGENSGSRMMEEIPGIPVPMPHWWENFRPYKRQCPTCTPIWLLCPSEDTGGWDGGDMLRLGSRTVLEMINKQQKLLPGYELMCEWKNDNCVGITGQRIVTSSTSSNVNKYV